MNNKEVIIVYEGIVREYDNALLLQAELEKRGYKVKLAYKMETLIWKKHNAICILPNSYTTENVEFYRYFLNANANPLISLQYEQVFSKKIENTGVHIPKGKAKDIWLFCWGRNCYDRLVRNGVDERKIKICGALQLDLLRKEFSDFYLSREMMALRFHIDKNKKWLFYISSFTYVNNDKLLNDAAKEFNDSKFINEFSKVSTLSQKITLEWFEKLINEDENIIVIYRPHPVEAENENVIRIAQKYPGRFRCISELSVKQWICVSDIISTWISTSVAEVYVAHKSLILIRPYPVVKENDIPFYYDAECTDSYEKLKRAVYKGEKANQMPVKKELLDEYYSIQDKPAYKRIADEIDMIGKELFNEKEKCFYGKRIVFLLKEGRIIKYLLKKIYQQVYFRLGWQIKSKKLREKYYVNDWENSIKHQHDTVNKDKLNLLRKAVRNE